MAVLLREACEQVPSGREMRRAATASNDMVRMVERDPRGSIYRGREAASATIAPGVCLLAVRTFVGTSFLKSEQ